MASLFEQAGILSSVPWTTFAMRAVGLSASGGTIAILLEPWDEHVAESLAAWRRAAGAQSVALQGYGDGRYCFHMTIAYTLFPFGLSVEVVEAQKQLEEGVNRALENLGPVTVRSPHLCHFSGMDAFHPITLSPPM